MVLSVYLNGYSYRGLFLIPKRTPNVRPNEYPNEGWALNAKHP